MISQAIPSIMLQVFSALMGALLMVMSLNLAGEINGPLGEAIMYGSLYYGLPLLLMSIISYYMAQCIAEEILANRFSFRYYLQTGLIQGLLLHPIASLLGSTEFGNFATIQSAIVFVGVLLCVTLVAAALGATIVAFLQRI